MMDPSPFAALSLIVAPAMLTNACSVFILSTSNRFARVVDRARALTRELSEAEDLTTPIAVQQLRELTVAEERSVLLVRALRSTYLALSAFAAATLLSLLGAVLQARYVTLIWTSEVLAVLSGVLAAASLMRGAVLLVRETRLAAGVLTDQAARLRLRVTSKATKAP
jgi:hypothetical protein